MEAPRCTAKPTATPHALIQSATSSNSIWYGKHWIATCPFAECAAACNVWLLNSEGAFIKIFQNG